MGAGADGRLDGYSMGRFSELLRSAFLRSRFEELLLYRLDKDMGNFTAPIDDYPAAMTKVLKQANADLWWRDLLREARSANPADPGLIEFGLDFGQAPKVFAQSVEGMELIRGPQLELKIKQSQSTYDVRPWMKRLGELEVQICRIEIPDKTAQGTGFLIGQNVVMTNYHVMELVHKGQISPTQVVLRFDYRVQEDGLTVNAGTTYRLAPDWLIDCSPYSKHDLEAIPSGDPTSDELDYALLRVEGNPGNDSVGGSTKDPTPTARKWIDLPKVPHDFTTQKALYILQHPDGKPIQIALDSDAVIDMNKNSTRVRYTTTTEPGSSGSPCFNADWRWVALHHSGDPKYWKPKYNQGIPLLAIEQLLAKRKKAGVFGSKI